MIRKIDNLNLEKYIFLVNSSSKQHYLLNGMSFGNANWKQY